MLKHEPTAHLNQLLWVKYPAQLWCNDVAETYFTKVASNPEYLALFRLIITESERFPELAKLYTQTVIQRGRKLLSQYFASHPELGITDPEATAQIFFGSLVSYVYPM